MSIQAKIVKEFQWTLKEVENRGFSLTTEQHPAGEMFVIRNTSHPDLSDDCRIMAFDTLAEVRCFLAGMSQQHFMSRWSDMFGDEDEEKTGD